MKLQAISTKIKDYIDAYKELGLHSHGIDLYYKAKCQLANDSYKCPKTN